MFVSTWLKQGQHTFGGWSLGGGEHQAREFSLSLSLSLAAAAAGPVL